MVATGAAKVKWDMIQLKGGVRRSISDQGRSFLAYDLEVAEWPVDKLLEYRLDHYHEALPAEESDSDMEADDAEPADPEDGDQADPENDEDNDRNDIEVDEHEVEDPLLDDRIEVPQTVMRAVGRLHRNLKHPSKLQLVRALRHRGATDAAIEVAERLCCTTCEELGRPGVGRKRCLAKLRKASKFGDQVALDLFVAHTTSRRAQDMLNMIDAATGFQVVVPVKSKQPSEIARAFETGGVPGQASRSPP